VTDAGLLVPSRRGTGRRVSTSALSFPVEPIEEFEPLVGTQGVGSALLRGGAGFIADMVAVEGARCAKAGLSQSAASPGRLIDSICLRVEMDLRRDATGRLGILSRAALRRRGCENTV
jgi:hypothetical protein